MASILKVDTIQDQAGNNIISESANVITIGASGDTITVPAGATVSGFTSAGIDDNATSTAITIDSSERVGVGTTSPDHLIHISASSSNAQLKLQRTGSATASFNISASSDSLAFSDQAASTERMRITSTGLGIGTSSPQQLINIESTGTAKIRYGYSSTVYGEFGRKSDGVHEWSSYENGGDLTFGTSQSNGSTTERMRIEANGLVRIKNTSHTNSLITNNHNLVLGNESSGAHGLAILAPTNENSYVSFFDSDNSGSFRGSLNYNHNDDSLRTYVNGSERMRVSSSGNIGINTTSPSELLHVNGHIVGNSLNIPSNTSSPPSGVTIHKPANDVMAFRTASTERMRIHSNGHVAIGTTASSADLELETTEKASGNNLAQGGICLRNSGTVSGGNILPITARFVSSAEARAGIGFVAQTQDGIAGYAGEIAFYTMGSADGAQLTNSFERVRINKSGQMGIGTSTPNRPLYVKETSNGNPAVFETGVNSSLGASNGTIVLRNYASRTANQGPWISFHISTSTTAGSTEDGTVIAGVASNSTNGSRQQSLLFRTRNSGTAEHFRIAHDGTLTATDTSIGSNSDERLKSNIENYSYDLNKFKLFQPRTFTWKNPQFHNAKFDESNNQIPTRGFVAQELNEIDDYWTDTVNLNSDDTEDYNLIPANSDGDHEAYTAKLGKKDAMYISVIQQLITKIETLEAKVTALETNNP